MRAHTSLRTAFRLGLMSAAVAGVSLATSVASAGDVGNGQGGGGSVGGISTSSGTASSLKFEHPKGLDTTIDTGMRGFSKASVTAKVGAKIKIDPVKDGGPLFKVDMAKGALVEASWGNDKKILLKAASGAQTDGTVTVRHTLTPELSVELGAFGITAKLNYNATQILQKMQEKYGANAKFQYDSGAKTQSFAPWGFTKVDTKLTAPDLQGAELFTLDIDRLPELVANNFDGEIGVRAVTDPTFSYKTTKITMAGGEGAISSAGGEVSVAAQDGDYLETTVAVEGEMSVAGEMKVQPFLHLTRIPVLGNANIDIPITAYSQKYTVAPSKVSFQSVTVHIPIPNVKAPSQGVDLGAVKAGGSASKTVTIENTGEMAASVSFKSSDGAFSVPSETVTIPSKGTYDLRVKFNSESAGPALSEITVVSNDPDSPEQTFKIGANGADVGGSKEDGDDLPSAGADSGCGCKTAGTSSSVPSWAGLGVLALGAVVFVRRRRSA